MHLRRSGRRLSNIMKERRATSGKRLILIYITAKQLRECACVCVYSQFGVKKR